MHMKEYSSAIRKEKFESLVRKWMYLETIILSEANGHTCLNILWFFLYKDTVYINKKQKIYIRSSYINLFFSINLPQKGRKIKRWREEEGRKGTGHEKRN